MLRLLSSVILILLFAMFYYLSDRLPVEVNGYPKLFWRKLREYFMYLQ